MVMQNSYTNTDTPMKNHPDLVLFLSLSRLTVNKIENSVFYVLQLHTTRTRKLVDICVVHTRDFHSRNENTADASRFTIQQKNLDIFVRSDYEYLSFLPLSLSLSLIAPFWCMNYIEGTTKIALPQ